MPSISLVVPAYNEEAGLARTVERCLATLRQCTDDFELIILDDASKDRTVAIMEELKNGDPAHIRTMAHATNQGIARTFEDLYKAATKEYVFLIPGDGQYPPEALIDIVPLLADHEIVICNRTYKDYTPWRQCISATYRWLPRILFGVDLYDSGSTKCVKRGIYEEITVRSRGVFVEAERIIRAAKRGYRIAKVDIRQEPRKGGKARGARWSLLSQALADVFSLWVDLVILRKKP